MTNDLDFGLKATEPTGDILNDACHIIETAQRAAYRAVDSILVRRNWLLGRRIAQEELKGEDRAKYGAEVIKKLSGELTSRYGKGFDYSSLYKFVRFYKTYPAILDSTSPKLNLLSWSHYRILLQVNDEQARAWYEREANSALKSKRKRRCSICSTRKRKWSEQFTNGQRTFERSIHAGF